MSYAMYGIEAFNEQEAAQVCLKVAGKVAEIQQILEDCDDNLRPIVERRLRRSYPIQQIIPPASGLGLLERQRQEMLRAQPAALGQCTNPLFTGIFGSIL